ncbi:MAG: hypothetical protein ABIH22_02190 [Candidatus Margulisiibacteriota bacterium]
MGLIIQPYSHNHKMSVHDTPRTKPSGIPQALIVGSGINQRLQISTISWMGRSYDCDPRQLGLLLSHGNHQNADVTAMGTTKIFWDSLPQDSRPKNVERPAWVLGRFQGKPGAPAGSITWTHVPDSKVPSLADGVLAKISSGLGSVLGGERCMENIIGCRGEDKDVVATHISEKSDRWEIVINEDGWENKHSERKDLIDQLSRIDVTDIERSELSADGKTLYLYSKLLVDEHGQPVRHKIDVSSLKLDPKMIYNNPDDPKFGIEITVPDENIDFECLEREHVKTFLNAAPVDTPLAVVKAYRDEQNRYVVRIEPKEPGKPKIELSASGDTVWQRREIKKSSEYKNLPQELKDAVLDALDLVLDVDNFTLTRVTKPRHRYELKFYRYRETRFKGILDKKLEDGESVVLTEVKGAAEVVHLNDHNGRSRGDHEIIPLNFDPFFGNKANIDLVRLDPRPDALRKSRFVDPVATSLAGQHLRDPYVMGVESMFNVWPKVDQLGFFGVFMKAAMAFPHGNMYIGPTENPWWVRWFGTTSHSIFDAKSDAGTRYHWLTGNPIHDKMLTSAAMITGPNTDTVNPAREGRLFHSRIPGMKVHMIKTAISGFYILVIEDADSSYKETTELGLVTETTIFPFSGGGGLSNVQLAVKTQRGQRWDAGRAEHTLDIAKEFATDTLRGNKAYVFLWNVKTGLFTPFNIDQRVDLTNTARKDTMSKVQPTAPKMQARVARAFNTARAVAKKYLLNEFREWFNVGTWYWVSLRQTFFYLVTPAMIILGMSALPAQGALFLVGCIAATLFAWPLWAIQMMKVGVNPKGILSFNPKHIFWSDLAMHTQIKSGLDIERMSVGKFRISDKSLGNRVSANDKKYAFWVAAVLPIIGGSALFSAAVGLGLAFGLLPLLYTALPFLLGYALSGRVSNWVKRLLPNQGSKSFFRSLARWAAGSVFLSGGMVGSLIAFGSTAIFTIPLSLALIAGFWALFMGLNIRSAFKIYFKEERLTYTLDAPNSPDGQLGKEKADSFRNTVREALGKGDSLYLPDEFTRHDDPYSRFLQNEFKDLSDIIKLCQEIDADAYGLTLSAAPNTLAWLNEVIEAPNFYDLWVAAKNIDLQTLHPEIKRLAKETESQRGKAWADLTFFDQEKIKQLNRAILEETYPQTAPKRPERKDPFELWDLINARIEHLQKQIRSAAPNVLNKVTPNPLVNLNNLIGGEGGVMIDLHHELGETRPSLREAIRFQLRNASGWKLLYPLEVYVALRRKLSIFLLARKTKKVRDYLQSLDRDKRRASLLEPEEYDRIRELNRLTIEEQFSGHTPEKWFAFPIIRDLANLLKRLRGEKQ